MDGRWQWLEALPSQKSSGAGRQELHANGLRVVYVLRRKPVLGELETAAMGAVDREAEVVGRLEQATKTAQVPSAYVCEIADAKASEEA